MKSEIDKIETMSGYVSMFVVIIVYWLAKNIWHIEKQIDQVAGFMAIVILPVFLYFLVIIPISLLCSKIWGERYEIWLRIYNKTKFNRVFIVSYSSLLAEVFFLIPVIAIVAFLSDGNSINETLFFPTYLVISTWAKISIRKGWHLWPVLAFFVLLIVLICSIFVGAVILPFFSEASIFTKAYGYFIQYFPHLIFFVLAVAIAPIPHAIFSTLGREIAVKVSGE